MISVKTKDILDTVQNHEENELALVEDTHTFYTWRAGSWQENNAPEASISMYQLNQQYYDRKEPLNSAELKRGKKDLKSFFSKRKSNYYLLLNNELHYYTFFVVTDKGNNIVDEIIDLISEFDNVKEIKYNPDNQCMEIWATFKGVTALFMLFDYAGGTIECQLH